MNFSCRSEWPPASNWQPGSLPCGYFTWFFLITNLIHLYCYLTLRLPVRGRCNHAWTFRERGGRVDNFYELWRHFILTVPTILDTLAHFQLFWIDDFLPGAWRVIVTLFAIWTYIESFHAVVHSRWLGCLSVFFITFALMPCDQPAFPSVYTDFCFPGFLRDFYMPEEWGYLDSWTHVPPHIGQMLVIYILFCKKSPSGPAPGSC